MIEEWRPIRNFESLYEVSNTGKIRSVSRVLKRTDENWHNRNGKPMPRSFVANYKSRELKPYYVGKVGKTKGRVKYHLHKRISKGYCGQSDVYVYADTLMMETFPELYERKIK